MLHYGLWIGPIHQVNIFRDMHNDRPIDYQ